MNFSVVLSFSHLLTYDIAHSIKLNLKYQVEKRSGNKKPHSIGVAIRLNLFRGAIAEIICGTTNSYFVKTVPLE